MRHVRSVAIILVALAAGASVFVFSHANPESGRTSALPLHMDEYVHWSFAKVIQDTGNARPSDSISTRPSALSTLGEEVHEQGFQLYLAIVQQTTGIDWVPLLEWWPAVVATLTALAVYALAEPWGAGVEAAALTIAIPSTLRFLGPAFVVPVVLALFLAIVAAGWLFHASSRDALALVGIVAASLWLVHALGAVLVAGLVLAYAAVAPGRTTSARLAVAAAGLVPLLLFAPTIATSLAPGAAPTELAADLGVIEMFGVITLALAAVGAIALVASTRSDERAAGGVLAMTLVAFELVIVLRLATGTDLFRLYDRTILVTCLLACVLGGVGIARLWRLAVQRVKWRAVSIALAAIVLLVPVTVDAASLRAELPQPTYTVVTDAQYAAFQEAAGKLTPAQKQGLVDGLGGMAFTVVTGRPTYWFATPNSAGEPLDVRGFFGGGASDTYYLLQTGTQVVVTDRAVSNPNLVQVSTGVYVVR